MSGFCVLIFLIILILKICDEVYCGCTLSVKDDFGIPSPVYLHNGGFLSPNPVSGDILLRRSETLLIACPGTKNFVVLGNNTTAFDTFMVKCVKDTTFRSTKTQWVGTLTEIKCTVSPWYTTEEVRASCAGNKLYRVGYNIQNYFYEVYQACFDDDLVRTVYVKEQLTPASNIVQGGHRPKFIDMKSDVVTITGAVPLRIGNTHLSNQGDVFPKVRMSQVYKLKNQKTRFKEILGSGMEDQYITKAQFLNRGHLAPRADFPLSAGQRVTFHYINTAPQWMRSNAGDWAALEDALRRRVFTYGHTVTVYTGTFGVCTLADKSSNYKEIYLDVDENNNGIVPVPLYFYKVVHDPSKQTAAAFISINSSYYNRTMIKNLSFCNDICEQNSKYAWLKWRSNDGAHSFCCTYEDFIRKIKDLPKLQVKGLFY